MMAANPTETLVQKSKFFEGIAEEHLAKLADLCQAVEFKERVRLFEQDASAKNVYIILDGQVSLVMCEPSTACRQIAEVGPGELIGWSPLVGRPRLFDTAFTLTEVKALRFDGAALMDYAAANPDFGFEFMKLTATTLAERLTATRLQLLQMCGMHFPTFEFQPEND